MEDESDEELLDSEASSTLSAREASRLGRCLELLLRCKSRWCPDATQGDSDGNGECLNTGMKHSDTLHFMYGL